MSRSYRYSPARTTTEPRSSDRELWRRRPSVSLCNLSAVIGRASGLRSRASSRTESQRQDKVQIQRMPGASTSLLGALCSVLVGHDGKVYVARLLVFADARSTFVSSLRSLPDRTPAVLGHNSTSDTSTLTFLSTVSMKSSPWTSSRYGRAFGPGSIARLSKRRQ